MHYNSPVGTGELQKSRQIIYPNPSSIEITIETSAIPTQSHLSISNLAGQQLITRQLTEQKTQLDVSTCPAVCILCGLRAKRLLPWGNSSRIRIHTDLLLIFPFLTLRGVPSL